MENILPLKPIENKALLNRASNPGLNQSQAPVPEFSLKPKNFKQKSGLFLKRIFKFFAVIFGLVISFYLLFFILTLANLDTKVFKVSLSGVVTDRFSKLPIENVSIQIDNKEYAKTNSKGAFSISNLELGKINIKVIASNYDEVNQEIEITRSFMNYTQIQNFDLVSSTIAALKGSFINFDSNYSFLNDSLFVNDNRINIQKDGTFFVQDIAVGLAKLTFQSSSFKDIELNFEIDKGANILEAINLEKTGDIVGTFKSYVREDIATDSTISIDNVTQDKINILENGDFRVKDLEIGKTYKVFIESKGYLSRTYSSTIRQGENALKDFRLVENGVAIKMMKQKMQIYINLN
jgi:hypothetical protein